MEPAPAVRLASTAVGPLISRLFRREQADTRQPDGERAGGEQPRPVPAHTEPAAAESAHAESAAADSAHPASAPRESAPRESAPAPAAASAGSDRLLAALVAFRGDSPTLGWEELLGIAGELVRLGLSSGEQRAAAAEEEAVAAALARTLWVIGELDTTETQAVRLGPQDYARRLRSAVPGVARELSPEAARFHDNLLITVCLHVIHMLLLRSPALAGRLPERSHRVRQLVDLNDVEAVRGRPEPSAGDAAFEERYLRHVAEQYSRVTIYGIDLPNPNTPDNWSLDTTYLSLAAEYTSETQTGVANARTAGAAPTASTTSPTEVQQ